MRQTEEESKIIRVPIDHPSRRKAGPYKPEEIGPIAGEVVIRKGERVFLKGRSQIAQRDIKLRMPLDKGEVGTAYNDYE